MAEKHDANGILLWITGLPGSGKSTLAREIYKRIRNTVPVVMTDGDVFREIMGNDLGHSIEDRRANAFRLARLNKYLVEHALVVICATVSLFSEVHKWNRANIPNMIEVFIEVPMEVLRERDHKNLYSKAMRGEIDNLVGVHQPFDRPDDPHIVITNKSTLEEFLGHAQRISQVLLEKYRG